jgi:hypothetical protein
VTGRCVAGKETLVVTVANGHDGGVQVKVETAYGVKQVASLAKGKSTSAAFTTRLASVPAGTVTTTVSTGQGDDRMESVFTTEHPALSCAP